MKPKENFIILLGIPGQWRRKTINMHIWDYQFHKACLPVIYT